MVLRQARLNALSTLTDDAAALPEIEHPDLDPSYNCVSVVSPSYDSISTNLRLFQARANTFQNANESLLKTFEDGREARITDLR